MDDKKRLEYYRLKDGDLLTVKYTSTVDIESFRLLLKDLKDVTSFLRDPDVQRKLSVGNDFRQHLSQTLHVTISDIAQRVEDLCNKPTGFDVDIIRLALGTFLIHSRELPLIDKLHCMLVNLPLSTVCHVDLLQLEETLLIILWHVAVVYHNSFNTVPINFDNVVSSFRRAQVTAGPISPPANPYVSSHSMDDHIFNIIFLSLQVGHNIRQHYAMQYAHFYMIKFL